ncbi:hypothetical protein BDBG_05313 [Blastomyces gilchristii SLH14081]|uniref:Uncharacterized protein n=1 Tax=Blastomyces gilchristii (strain SLH14081) TaxID=559298 RepID=A0A179UQR9_BLAGS|nr:uncharacterized protein BDBG_05313 [Blastomyces gilchristii SLH14081]OAT09559.1 hypothetical protein BDBG_05313 [Blastomyces gilchristii SLH14081]
MGPTQAKKRCVVQAGRSPASRMFSNTYVCQDAPAKVPHPNDQYGVARDRAWFSESIQRELSDAHGMLKHPIPIVGRNEVLTEPNRPRFESRSTLPEKLPSLSFPHLQYPMKSTV